MIQWENLNSNRNFPFDLTASLVSESGTHVQDNILVDAFIMRGISPALGGDAYDSPVWVSNIHISNSMFSICICDNYGGVASFSISRTAFIPYNVYRCNPLRNNISALLTFGDISFPDNFDEVLNFKLTSSSGRLSEAIVASFLTSGVTKITDDVSGTSISGDVPIEFRSNFVKSNITRNEDGVFVADIAITDSGNDTIAGPCNADVDPDVCGAIPIKSINGVSCTADGEIAIRFKS